MVSLAVSSGYIRLRTTGLTGQQYWQVAPALARLGLHPARQDAESNAPAGTVLALTPSRRVKVGTTITSSVAVAPPPPTTVTTPAPTTKPTAPTTLPSTKAEGAAVGTAVTVDHTTAAAEPRTPMDASGFT